MSNDCSLFQSICQLLDQERAVYRHLHHQPTYTSQQSAQARGEEVKVGGKSLLVRTGDVFRIFVISAALKLDSLAIRRHFSERQSRFATEEELLELTGLVPGSVPPWGEPILPFDLYADESVFENDRIAFNAGSLTDSIIMPIDDYRRVARPTVFHFTKRSLD